MSVVEDVQLLVKKIVVTVVIYLVPVTITVGGLLLTEFILSDDSNQSHVETVSKNNQPKHN